MLLCWISFLCWNNLIDDEEFSFYLPLQVVWFFCFQVCVFLKSCFICKMSDLKLFTVNTSVTYINYFYLGKLFLLTRADIFGLSIFLFLKSFCVVFFLALLQNKFKRLILSSITCSCIIWFYLWELFLFTRWVSMNALTFDLVLIISWMNILHAVTSAKRETAPQIRKLKSSCGGGSDCPVSFPKAELKKRLTPIEYHVTQERGTEK